MVEEKPEFPSKSISKNDSREWFSNREVQSLGPVGLSGQRPKNGAGGGNRTHGLGIMRPSLYH